MSLPLKARFTSEIGNLDVQNACWPNEEINFTRPRSKFNFEVLAYWFNQQTQVNSFVKITRELGNSRRCFEKLVQLLMTVREDPFQVPPNQQPVNQSTAGHRVIHGVANQCAAVLLLK